MKTKQEYANAYAFPGCILMLHKNHEKTEQTNELLKKHGRMKSRWWFKRVKDANRRYIETGVMGSYDVAHLVDKEWNSIPVPLFEDTEIKDEPGKLCLERRMMVGGKQFVVSSVFPANAALTPTDKLISLIDKERNV